MDLLGSSIGAWRYATYCRADFKQAFEHFEHTYFTQRYSDDADREEITRVITGMLEELISKEQEQEILDNPKFRINLFADRSRGITNTDKRLILSVGLITAAKFNLLSRSTLSWFFERTLFHHPDSTAEFIGKDQLPTERFALNESNLKAAILASGSIPMVVDGIEIEGAKPGLYRDGGLVDYHMNLPFEVSDGLVLHPHFSPTVYPGWMDKYLKFRKPNLDYFNQVLLVCPSDEFIKSLPLSKIPDRSDFERFVGDDAGRVDYWREVTKRSEQLGNELLHLFETEKPLKFIKPISELA